MGSAKKGILKEGRIRQPRFIFPEAQPFGQSVSRSSVNPQSYRYDVK